MNTKYLPFKFIPLLGMLGLFVLNLPLSAEPILIANFDTYQNGTSIFNKPSSLSWDAHLGRLYVSEVSKVQRFSDTGQGGFPFFKYYNKYLSISHRISH
jgi:hypothetical protein